MNIHSELDAVAESPKFTTSRSPYLLLGSDLAIRAANEAYLSATGRSRDDLYGKLVFEAFPDNPADPRADGVRNLSASLEKVLSTGRTSRMWVQRYDIPGARPEDEFRLRYWSPVNTPIPGDPRERTVGVVHHVEDVTALWAPLHSHGGSGAEPVDVPSPEEWKRLIAALSTNEQIHEELVDEVARLHNALTSRIVIEQAKGILMAQRRCSPEEAFEVLRRVARSGNLNLHSLAAALVAQAQDAG